MDHLGASPLGADSQSKSKVSILQPYSIGKAAANLAVGQSDLMVTPLEKFTHLDGEVTDYVSTYTTSGKDGSGNSYSDVTEASVALKASWLSRNPWLKLPGLVRRGEFVQIWRVGDTDQYYWELLGLSNDLRRKDILLLVISNTRDESTTELTAQNSVFFTIDTVDKHVTLSTPKNDGEAAAYYIQLNWGEGNFSLSDDIGQAFVLDSVKTKWLIKNAMDSLIKIEAGGIDIESPKHVKIKTPLFDVDADTLKMEGQTSNINYTTQTLTGTTLGLNYSATTGGSAGGTFTFNGQDVNFDGGSVKHDGKTIDSNHQHDKVQSGNSNSGKVV